HAERVACSLPLVTDVLGIAQGPHGRREHEIECGRVWVGRRSQLAGGQGRFAPLEHFHGEIGQSDRSSQVLRVVVLVTAYQPDTLDPDDLARAAERACSQVDVRPQQAQYLTT